MTDKLKCPKCGFSGDFKDAEVGCEDCGSHPAVKCPKCEESYDQIYNKQCAVCSRIVPIYGKCPDHPDERLLEMI